MGLLDKLWDDTLAGPRPETGLGRLRKHASFSLQINSGKDEIVGGGISRTFSDDLQEEEPRVTRSIMIKRPAGCPSPVGGTPPASPADSTPPLSPFRSILYPDYDFTKTPVGLLVLNSGSLPISSNGMEWNRFRRKSSSDAYERACGGGRLAKSHSSPYEV